MQAGGNILRKLWAYRIAHLRLGVSDNRRTTPKDRPTRTHKNQILE